MNRSIYIHHSTRLIAIYIAPFIAPFFSLLLLSSPSFIVSSFSTGGSMLHLLTFSLFIISVNGISPFLKYYEPLNYRAIDLARVSRSSQSQANVRLEFDAFNRTFVLRLRKISPEESVFLEDATVEFSNYSMKIDRDLGIYKGTVEGDDHSYVYGSIDDGVFNGVIETGDGKEYGIEYSAHHNSSVPFHSFIYDVAHIITPKRNQTKRPISPSESEAESMCGLSDPKIAESIKIEKDKSSIPPYRSKRNANGLFEEEKTCIILFHIDHLLYQHYYNGVGKKNDEETTKRLQKLIEKEMEGVNRVYQKTKFGDITGISFRLQNTKARHCSDGIVATTCFQIWRSANDPDYPFKDENVDVNGFLAINSMEDYGKVCLGYVLTYRDFSGGTLGLAYVGGLCSMHRANRETQKSTNAGIVTYLNFGAPVLDRISYLTLAHEIGHNFGSNHDETDECKGGSEGQFIMWYAATSGDQPNNKEFSECSKKQMTAKLYEVMKIDPKANDKHARNCFIKSDEPICGNGIIETSKNGVREECDCGPDEKACAAVGDTKCCTPGNMGDAGCKLRTGMACAPSQGDCCDNNCKFMDNTHKCKEAKDCSKASMCDQTSAKCPEPASANDGNPCDDSSGKCVNGICNQTLFCETQPGYTHCDSDEKSCFRYCMKDGKCTSTAKIDAFNDPKYTQKGRWGQAGVMLKQQSQCLKNKGLCDMFDICKEVKVTGLLRRKFEEFASFFEGLTKKWWVIAIIVIVVIIVLVVVIKFCSYATPSSNPNKPKAKSIKQIKNMMSDRVKKMSKRAVRKVKKGKGKGAGSAQTPGEKKANEEEE